MQISSPDHGSDSEPPQREMTVAHLRANESSDGREQAAWVGSGTGPASSRSWALGDRFGWVVLAASLAVVGFMSAFLMDRERDLAIEQVRAHGAPLANMLSSFDLETLTATNARSVLDVAIEGGAASELAYISVNAPDGTLLTSRARRATPPPVSAAPSAPSEWHAQHGLAGADGSAWIDFQAPVLDNGELIAMVHVGFRAPTMGPSMELLSTVASVSLPIFLLAPLLLFLVRSQSREVLRASGQLTRMLEESQFTQIVAKPDSEFGRFVGIVNALADRNARQASELEIAHDSMQTTGRVAAWRRQRLEAVMEAHPEAMIVIDDGGQVTFGNAKVEPMLGLAGELKGHTLGERLRDASLNRVADLVHRSTGNRARTSTVRVRVGDRDIEVTAVPLREKAGRNVGTLLTASDVTAATLAEQSRADFVAHVAHELKSPLNVLSLQSQMLLTEDGDDQALRFEACNVVQDEVERLARMIDNILTITRMEFGSHEVSRVRVRLREFLVDIFENAQRDATNVRFELDLPRELPAVMIDKDFMRVALNNLLSNAIKYNRDQGTVRLSARETSEALEIEVTDTGLGIAADDAERVFDKFYRSDDDAVQSRSGHGLGLALVREIVTLHHGRIALESVSGEGSTFRLTLDKHANLLKEAV